MAERRMFAKSIVQSRRFLKMPATSRELYFQLGLAADDDGVVEAWNVMQLTRATEDDLRVLVARGYIVILDNEDLVSYLTDWNANNLVRKDRYHSSIYKDLLLQFQNNNLIGQPVVNQRLTEDRLGKDSLINTSKDVLSCSNPKTDIYDEIVSYLNQKSGAHFKAKTAATRRHISARLKEGFALDDFKSVIDAKTTEWLNDKKMRQYIRPETLFGTKFEGYLNEAQRAKPKSKYADALKKMDEDIANRMKDFVDTGEFN